jgi:ABC-2 type transport system permease protein
MTHVLIRKLLRDLRLQLLIVALLLVAFECLWAKVTQRITQELLPALLDTLTPADYLRLLQLFFKGPGQVMEALIGGDNVDVKNALDVLTIGYVHPLAQTILCVWAIGRAAGAITGEIDRGTMELLLAQPLARTQVVLAHLGVDLVVIPILCLAMWAGSWLGVAWFGEIVDTLPPTSTSAAPMTDLLKLMPAADGTPRPHVMQVNPMVLWRALPQVAALLFAVSGVTLWLSSRGRFRGRVLGLAIGVMLVQFLVNLIGQLWPAVAPLRPLTLFFYYQPQQAILKQQWNVDVGAAWQLGQVVSVPGPIVLMVVGLVGYALALWTFRRRDVPAPL